MIWKRVIWLVPLLAAVACSQGITAPDQTGGSGTSTSHTGGSTTGTTGTLGTFSPPVTYFLDNTTTLAASAGWVAQAITISSPTRFVLRLTADYAVQGGIITPDQLASFKASASGFATVSGSGFDRAYGTHYFTLAPGTYYVAVRNAAGISNPMRYELDYDIAGVLPSDSRATFSFVDLYVTGSKYVPKNGGKLVQMFTVQAGYRYFLDGCNTGVHYRLIPASEVANFQSGQSFKYYPGHSSDTPEAPGFEEINLAPGDYALAFSNDESTDHALTYTLERWRVVAR